MRITVNNTDVTAQTVSDSVKWRRYGAFLTELTFSIVIKNSGYTDIKTGMGAELYIGDERAWGGIVSETKESHRSKDFTYVTVKCKGYESVAARRVCNGISYTEMTAGQIAKKIFNDYLVKEEGFNDNDLNYESDGEILQSYSSAGAKISKLFDDLSQACGKKWWINSEKELCFKQKIPIKDEGLKIDLDGNEGLKSISDVRFEGRASDYRNVQIVFGKNNVRGEARNEAEISRMATFGGSGEYANITVNRNILTEEAADEAAANILKSYENESVTVNFKTAYDGFDLFEKIKIRADKYGYSEFTDFIITEINANSLVNGEFIYEVVARYTSGEEIGYRPPDGWKEQFGQLVNKNDGNVQGSGGNSNGGMSPDDILAGTNITLEKTDKTVKIHAVQEKLMALKRADFTENGVSYTLENGTVCEYTFGFDGAGELTSLTDKTGNTIYVSGI